LYLRSRTNANQNSRFWHGTEFDIEPIRGRKRLINA
jgi:hypothetical protein